MENVNRNGFETQWQAAFQGAEAQPAGDVWMAIESALIRVENENNKQRVVVYRRMAATLAICLLASGSFTVLKWTHSENNSAGQSQTEARGKASEAMVQQPASDNRSTSATEAGHAGPGTGANTFARKIPFNKSLIHSSSVAMMATPGTLDATREKTIAGPMDLAPMEVQTGDSIAVIVHEPPKSLTAEEERALVKKLLAEPEIVVKKKKPGLWASVGAAAGSYVPEVSVGGLASPQSVNVIPSPSSSMAEQRPAEGVAYSVGVLVGKQIGSRIQLQAGLTYMNQRTDYTSNVVSVLDSRVTLLHSAGPLGASGYGLTSAYTVNSSSNYLSLPLQVGYLIVDRKIGLAINAGLATDLFLTNTLSDASGQLRPITQHAGDQGLYRRVSFAGLSSIEITYRLADRYQVAVVPGVRYSLTNVYQEDLRVNRPFVFDVGFRFRYILR